MFRPPLEGGCELSLKAARTHPHRFLSTRSGRELPVEPGDSVFLHLFVEISSRKPLDFDHPAAVPGHRRRCRRLSLEVLRDGKSVPSRRFDPASTRE